ncbi:MAG: WYL domain-containing protein [Candidatus Dormibacteraeota bacterium]|nr:WYL domain-containing protein [Candidatus Dormibacteraeota bacterium]
MRADRLISIVLLLQAHGRLTAGALAERLEVSLRTVHRDLEALGMAGIPVVVERGRMGGASLLDGYRTELTGLSEDELRALMALGAGTLATDLGMGTAFDSASLKLAAATGHRRGHSLQQRVLVDGEGWTRRRTVPDHLRRVQDALWSDRRLRLRYRRGEERVVERVVEPYGLVCSRGTWYLMAEVAGGRRVYRVSRIEEAEVLPEAFERAPDFDLEAAWSEAVARFRGTERVRVTVRPDPEVLGRFLRTTDAVTRQRPDGVLELEVPSPEIAAGLLAPFGGAVEVLSPPRVRQLLAEIGRGLVGRYS